MGTHTSNRWSGSNAGIHGNDHEYRLRRSRNRSIPPESRCTRVESTEYSTSVIAGAQTRAAWAISPWPDASRSDRPSSEDRQPSPHTATSLQRGEPNRHTDGPTEVDVRHTVGSRIGPDPRYSRHPRQAEPRHGGRGDDTSIRPFAEVVDAIGALGKPFDDRLQSGRHPANYCPIIGLYLHASDLGQFSSTPPSSASRPPNPPSAASGFRVTHAFGLRASPPLYRFACPRALLFARGSRRIEHPGAFGAPAGRSEGWA
ncbi:hypothetical protein TL08_19960 [Actinoalloteichus hymeniacidonis]|uniref:Uncharacterized protein n=1 Tax=Actinoalloteichus hymeniacidonis TaxID=340345 RepID=A0AAC9MYW0_9PSEU|nr:hypothetical protein TL08_19960 [Actinoalloteichus hymeniacidonis]